MRTRQHLAIIIALTAIGIASAQAFGVPQVNSSIVITSGKDASILLRDATLLKKNQEIEVDSIYIPESAITYIQLLNEQEVAADAEIDGDHNDQPDPEAPEIQYDTGEEG